MLVTIIGDVLFTKPVRIEALLTKVRELLPPAGHERSHGNVAQEGT